MQRSIKGLEAAAAGPLLDGIDPDISQVESSSLGLRGRMCVRVQ